MLRFFRDRSQSLAMVTFVLLLILVLQERISYSVSFGALDAYVPYLKDSVAAEVWLVLRSVAVAVTVLLWLMNRKEQLFRAIIVANALLTLGLTANMASLLAVLGGFSSKGVETLLVDVVLMAVTNVLIFSIWYWVIDPPGVDERQRDDEPWDFLFPQRGSSLPRYEEWKPRYTDYLFVAFTTSVAFSPTDTLPLSRRAKILMLLQSVISIVTITGIAGSAINILAGNA